MEQARHPPATGVTAKRWRPLRTWLIAAVIATAACALLSAVSAIDSGSAAPPWHSTPLPTVPNVAYTITVNGHTQKARIYSPVPHFPVALGEKLTVTVSFTSHAAISKLWFGVDNGTECSRPDGTPVMHPVLAAASPGPSGLGGLQVRCTWTMPTRLGDDSTRQLALAWSWPAQPGFPEPGTLRRDLAVLDVSGRPGP